MAAGAVPWQRVPDDPTPSPIFATHVLPIGPSFSLLYQSLSLLKQQVFLLKNLFLRKPPIAKSSGIPNPMIFTVVPMIILPNPRKSVFPLAPGPGRFWIYGSATSFQRRHIWSWTRNRPKRAESRWLRCHAMSVWKGKWEDWRSGDLGHWLDSSG